MVKLPKRLRMRRHVVIGDAQTKPGVPLNHLVWIRKYIAEKHFDVLVNIGDFADMHSLSYYAKGKLEWQGRNVKDDIDCTHLGLELLHEGRKGYDESIITLGNHEARIDTAVNNAPELDGLISIGHLGYDKHYDQVVDFGDETQRDGVSYSHFFHEHNSPRPVGGMMTTKLRKIGYSFVAGHAPGLEMHSEMLGNGQIRAGVINGSCYLHFEDYKKQRGNNTHFRGLVVLNEVENGSFQPMPVSLRYLCRIYEGMSLYQFSKKPSKWITFGKADKNAMRWVGKNE